MHLCERSGPGPSAPASEPRIYATLSAPPYQHAAAALDDPLGGEGLQERSVEERPPQARHRDCRSQLNT
jgi:hypothetical protein